MARDVAELSFPQFEVAVEEIAHKLPGYFDGRFVVKKDAGWASPKRGGSIAILRNGAVILAIRSTPEKPFPARRATGYRVALTSYNLDADGLPQAIRQRFKAVVSTFGSL